MKWFRKLADMATGPAPYTGETPQKINDRQQLQRDYTNAPLQPPETHNWAATPIYVLVGQESPQELMQKLEWHDGLPYATGELSLAYRWDADWQVLQSNMSLRQVETALRKYTKDHGWNFLGLSTPSGDKLSRIKIAEAVGIGEINPGVKDWKKKEWSDMETFDNGGNNGQHPLPDSNMFTDPTSEGEMSTDYVCSDCGYPASDYNDWRGHIMREHVRGGEPQEGPYHWMDQNPTIDLDDPLPAHWNKDIMDQTVMRQSSWHIAAIMYHATWSDYVPEILERGLHPEDPGQSSFNAADPTWESDDPTGAYLWGDLATAQSYARDKEESGWVTEGVHVVILAVDTEGLDLKTDLSAPDSAVYSTQPIEPGRISVVNERTAAAPPAIPGPIPFIYDIDQDRIYVGHPGQRVSDIQGQFTPGGIVEGNYDPKGNVQIRTDTDMPYTVKHMVQLWYAMHPELEVKGVHLLVGQEQHRLASANIGHQVRNIAATDPAAWAAFEALSPYGAVYVVGGAVRDIVLGKTPKDIDLMVQGMPIEDVRSILTRLPGRVDETGADFSVLRYRDPEGYEVEVALPRREQSTGAGHKDFDVKADPFMSVEEDLSRRDFTANAMAVNLATGELVDPYHGSEDVKNRTLQTVSENSFKEDPLRMLRTLVAISRHQLMPTRETLESIRDKAYLIEHIPAERVQAELDKMMEGDNPSMAISLLEDTGIFRYIVPEYEKTIGFDQHNPNHDMRLHDHMKSTLSEMTKMSDDKDLRWAALLHDIGKPRSQWLDPETGTGYYYQNKDGHGGDHWAVGADMTKGILGRLRFPNDRIDRITHLIDHHMFPKFEDERGARKFINRVGDEHADDLLRLRRADISGRQTRVDDVPTMWQHVKNVREQQQPTSVRSLAINGNDLIAAGFQPGPQMGALLNHLTDQVVENPELNDRETLMQMAVDSWDATKTANILDPVQKTLDPAVFQKEATEEPRVKQRVINWVRTKIYDTMTTAGWPEPSEYLSLILTGSLTTYQWSEHSDFDISLWIDVERFPEWVRADMIKLMIEKCDGTIVPGTTHPLQCFVVDSNKINQRDLYQPGLRSAYDLDRMQWIVPPEHREIDVAKVYRSALVYAREVVDKVKMMLRYGNDDALKTYWHFLHRQRHRDMAVGKGDFATSNIVYKLLSNEDLMPEISQATGEYIA